MHSPHLSRVRREVVLVCHNHRSQHETSQKNLPELRCTPRVGGDGTVTPDAALGDVRSTRESRTPIRVLLADDHAIVREGVGAVLQDAGDVVIVAEAADGGAAVEQYRRHKPDVALIDVKMPTLDGPSVVAAIRACDPSARIVMLTTYDADDDIERAFKAGAAAYVLKDVSPQDLVSCVRTVHAGRAWVAPAIAAKLATRLTRVELTPRELEVLRLLSTGVGNKEIGVRLGIAESTVKVHVMHLFEKLEVTSRTEAAAVAVRRGLVKV